jgi:hypothetical protein
VLEKVPDCGCGPKLIGGVKACRCISHHVRKFGVWEDTSVAKGNEQFFDQDERTKSLVPGRKIRHA